MNCPSRVDEDVLEHPDWNQSPPYLASDLTTCQDLNGIANIRELRTSTAMSTALLDSGEKVEVYALRPPANITNVADTELSYGHSALHKKTDGGEGQIRSNQPGVFSGSTMTRARDHTPWVWIVFIAISSALSFCLGGVWSANPIQHAVAGLKPYIPVRQIKRAGSTCPPNKGISESEYNTPLHVGALFIILFVSTLACAFPLIATRFPFLQLSTRFFFAVRHFGTGVLIATAFVHLLPTAFISLGNPCLSNFWTEDYPAMPGAIALAGIFFVVILEMTFHPSRGIASNRPDPGYELRDGLRGDLEPSRRTEAASSVRRGVLGAIDGRRPSNFITRQATNELDTAHPADQSPSENRANPDAEQQSTKLGFIHELSPEQKLRKDIMQCVMLEVGILFHSVFIGMALSVSIGTEFIILLIAISFHQTFEGLALGSRIASIVWPNKTLQPWLMALAYGCTTPFGQALGIAIHSLYSPDSEIGLVLVGIMNAISAGLLTFASLVELLSEDFLSDESWRTLRGSNRIYACLLVFFGAFSMSLVGAWA